MDNKKKVEFGDFQTPVSLCQKVVSIIPNIDEYDLAIEPTCGEGNFLFSVLNQDAFNGDVLGWEINVDYIELAQEKLKNFGDRAQVINQDFFQIDWSAECQIEAKTLYIGNPPWVTNSILSKMQSQNLPQKINFQGLKGLDALTGKSNFDISEWMLIKLLLRISNTQNSMAMLIKTSVARKLVEYVHRNALKVGCLKILKINSKKTFDVAVDACLFLAFGSRKREESTRCEIYSEADWSNPEKVMGFAADKMVADIDSYQEFASIDSGSEFKWRSGVKHDLSKVMELKLTGDNRLVNGFDEDVSQIENEFLYFMYKSSEISKKQLPTPNKMMIVTQKFVKEDTSPIRDRAKNLWAYLNSKIELFNGRKSSIYKQSPEFSIFGVGDYTFQPYKIAISGMYKNVLFSKIMPIQEKPIVLDDTCYFLGFDNFEKMNFVFLLLTSEPCKKFIDSLIFLDNKRPVTTSLLNRINLREIARILNLERDYENHFAPTDQLL